MENKNEVIAEFMGLQRLEPGEYNLVSYWEGDPLDKSKRHFKGYIDQLKYHVSWAWLMPAILKFQTSPLPEDHELRKQFFELCDQLDDAVTNEYNITDAFEQLVICLGWYNANKPTN